MRPCMDGVPSNHAGSRVGRGERLTAKLELSGNIANDVDNLGFSRSALPMQKQHHLFEGFRHEVRLSSRHVNGIELLGDYGRQICLILAECDGIRHSTTQFSDKMARIR